MFAVLIYRLLLQILITVIALMYYCRYTFELIEIILTINRCEL